MEDTHFCAKLLHEVTKYFLGLTCTRTDINNGNRNRFAMAAKFGALDPIVTFFHSHDVIYPCNCYFRVRNPFVGYNKNVVNTTFMAKSERKYVRRRVTSRGTTAWSPQKEVSGQKRAAQALATACYRLRPWAPNRMARVLVGDGDRMVRL